MLKRNKTIDLSKYIASVLIIAIHSKLFTDVNNTLSFVTIDIICRFAVPFFAICTGYFMTEKCDNKGYEENKHFFWKHWKKLIIIYIVWTIIYLLGSIPKWIEIGWFSLNAFVDYGISAILTKPYYHMWYLLSVLYALPLLAFCLKYVKKEYFKWIAVVLWTIKVLSYAYCRWLPIPFQDAFNLMEKFSGIRDGLFCILPLMLLGACIYYEKKRKRKFYLLGFIIFLILLILEAFILKYMGQDAVSFVIFTFPTSYFLFNSIMKLKIPLNAKICFTLSGASLFIYLVHPLIVDFVKTLIKSSVLCFIVTTIIATALGVIYMIITGCFKKRKKPKSEFNLD